MAGCAVWDMATRAPFFEASFPDSKTSSVSEFSLWNLNEPLLALM